MGVIPDDFFQPEPFFIEFSGGYLHGDLLQQPDSIDDPPAVLFLHGSGNKDDRTGFSLVRQILLNYHGISSCAFDFVGHGGTSGEGERSSLVQRTAQVQDIVDACFDCQPFSIVAIGTGAYPALKLAALAPVRSLTLIAPVLHVAASRAMDSDETTGEQLYNRAPSLDDLGLCQIVQNFQGGVHLISTEHDQKAASQLIAELKQNSAISCEHSVLGTPQNFQSHELMELINGESSILMNVARTSANMCALSEGACL